MNKIKENALYRYHGGSGWCKHGIVYTVQSGGRLWAVDTYWASTFPRTLHQDLTYYDSREIAKDLEFIMMIDEAVQIGKEDFWLYDEKDRLFIPTGGWHERHLIKKTAEKQISYVSEHVDSLLNETQRAIENLKRDIEKLELWQRGLKANPDIASYYSAECLWDMEYALTRNISK